MGFELRAVEPHDASPPHTHTWAAPRMKADCLSPVPTQLAVDQAPGLAKGSVQSARGMGEGRRGRGVQTVGNSQSGRSSSPVKGSGPPRSSTKLLAPQAAFEMLALLLPNAAVNPNPDLWGVGLDRSENSHPLSVVSTLFTINIFL